MLTTLALAAAVATAPQPAGKWVIDYGEHMCILQHAYAADGQNFTLGFRPWPLSPNIEVVALVPKAMNVAPEGDAVLTLAPSGTRLEGHFTSVYDREKSQRIVLARMKMDDYRTLGDAERVSLAFGKTAPLTLDLPKSKTAMAALDTCQQQAITRLGADPAEIAKVSEKATPTRPFESWFGPSAYPVEARRARQTGRVIAFVAIGNDGAVGDCRVIQPSGVTDLDQETCAIFTKRTRWNPARDAQGAPVASHQVLAVNWQLN